MEHVQQIHEYLLRQRTNIRNHRRTLNVMKACWKLVPRADLNAMSREEYEGMYSMLLYEMTICWEEETNDAFLAKMWHRDASSFPNLDFNRFCCSIFYFAEMWVQEITPEAYDRIFQVIRTNLASQEFAPTPSSAESVDPAFKPTLESFDDAFDRERNLESMHLNIGKSITFDANKYFQHLGSPTESLQASNPFQLQERPTSTSSLRSNLAESNYRRDRHYGGVKITKSGCSNPKLLRPMSSRQSRVSVYDSTESAHPGSPPPSVSRTANPFLSAGTLALKPPTTM